MNQLDDNADFLGRVAGGAKFSLVIDDGLHEEEAMASTFASFRPHLDDDFVYIVEDVRHSSKFLQQSRADFHVWNCPSEDALNLTELWVLTARAEGPRPT